MNRIFYILVIVFTLYQSSVSAVAELPDPTRPADYFIVPEVIEVYELPAELIDWYVTAIRINGNDRSAIINGQLVKEGQTIGPAKVLEIKPVSVVLDYEDRQVVVRLYNNVVEKKNERI